MKNNKIIELAAIGFIGVVLVPIVVNTTLNVIGYTSLGVRNLIQNVKYKKKIKDGLKDGSIVEIDGQFYEVKVEDHVEEA